MCPRLAPLVLVPCALLALRGGGEAQSFTGRGDYDLRPLGESLRGYYEARSSTVGLEAAKESLDGALAALRETTGGGEPLERVFDLAHALWLSRGYSGRTARPGKIESAELELGSFHGAGLHFAYRVPRTYDPSRRAYPLLLAIPDWDEGPEDHLRAHWSASEFRDEVIVVCPEMPTAREEWDRVLVNGRPGGLCHVLTALRLAGERFAVDFDRVYVAGRGKGVPAAVAAGNHSPHRFAGIIGRGGDLDELAPDNFGNLPTWFAGAGGAATLFRDALKEAGFDNCQLHPEGGEAEAWGWMQEHPRRTWPERVTLVTGDPFPTRAYWLRVAPCAPDARAVATIDVAKNAIHIDGEGIARVTLYLNDQVVDLDAPVSVFCNGTRQRVVIARHLADTLDMIQDGTSDAASVYTARASLDWTGAPDAGGAESIAGADPDYDRRRAEAGGDAAKLWELHQWCLATQRTARAPAALRGLLRVDPEHTAARAALGHQRYLERWFTTPAALARFQRSQEAARAAAKGHVQHRGQWMHPDERRLANKGLTKDDETGLWLTSAERRRLAEGWVRQDLEWIRPADAVHVDEGRWIVDGEWLELAEANGRHARIESMWRIPGPDVLLYSTADREVSLVAMEHMGRALADLNRVFGAEPMLPLPVAMLRDEEQYDLFAFGDPDGWRPATHAGRRQAIHSAFFSESWFPLVDGKREYRGMGVCLWDAQVPNGNLYGVHAARLAVGLSYVEALDPSPKAVRKALSTGPTSAYFDAFEAEKILPGWLRYGGAVYAERFFRDPDVGEGGDEWWARTWSLGNLRQWGGLRAMSEVLAFRLNPDDRTDGLKLLVEAGLLVAFLVDGDCAPVVEEHAKFKKAMLAGRVSAAHVEALTKALLGHEAELRAFAGL